MKVRIYAPHINRLEFIRFQMASIKTHVLDDWEYIVVNDAINEPFLYNFLEKDMRDRITGLCNELNVECLEFPQDLHTNRDKIFPKLQFFGDNPSTRASDVYQWTLQHSLDFDGLVVIMDGDMFFTKDISFESLMGQANLAYLPQTREGIEYPWLNLVCFYPKSTPSIQDFSYDCGSVNGVSLDSGGLSYYYLQANKDALKIRYIQQKLLDLSGEPLFDLSEYKNDLIIGPGIIPYLSMISNREMFIHFEVLDDCIVHYGRGSNWTSDPIAFHQIRIKTFLETFAGAMFGK